MQVPRLSPKMAARTKALSSGASSVRDSVIKSAAKAVAGANKQGRNRRGQLCRNGVGPDGWCKQVAPPARVDTVIHKWENPRVDTVYVGTRSPTGGAGGTKVNIVAAGGAGSVALKGAQKSIGLLGRVGKTLAKIPASVKRGRDKVGATATGALAAKYGPRTARVIGTGARVGLKMLTRGRL